jgi:hypothetical protein
MKNISWGGEKWVNFYMAALDYCRLWTQDARNVNNAGQYRKELDRSRARLYDAYQALPEAHQTLSTPNPYPDTPPPSNSISTNEPVEP